MDKFWTILDFLFWAWLEKKFSGILFKLTKPLNGLKFFEKYHFFFGKLRFILCSWGILCAKPFNILCFPGLKVSILRMNEGQNLLSSTKAMYKTSPYSASFSCPRLVCHIPMHTTWFKHREIVVWSLVGEEEFSIKAKIVRHQYFNRRGFSGFRGRRGNNHTWTTNSFRPNFARNWTTSAGRHIVICRI